MRDKQKHKQKNRPKQKHLRAVAVIFIFVFAAIGGVLLYSYFYLSTPDLPSPPLKDLATSHGVEIGVLASARRLGSQPYTDILASQYSFITVDGEAHWVPLRPAPNEYDYTKLDKLMTFARDNNKSVQVHHLVWGEEDALPAWLKNGNYSKTQILDFIHSDITNVVGRYKGRVAVWTVVNEAFSRAQHIYGLQDWWADHVADGTEFIDDSFIWAHQADPDAKLILNDFYNESQSSVSDAEYDYIKAAKARGVPIDGIGIQMHIDSSYPPNKEAVIKNIQRFGAIGVDTYITEFDVNTNSVKGSAADKLRLESKLTYEMARACIESKSCVSFNVFGVTEKDSLLKKITNANSRSYFFTSRYQPKQSFYDFRQAWLAP
jgi:endo-1,4-beta-xylanase